MDDLVLQFILIFMLVAGAGAFNTPFYGGALTFDVYVTPSWSDWNRGSAFSCEYPA